jgi:hypothetical protein
MTAPHPLVAQLRFTRAEFLRGVTGVPPEDAVRRLAPMNCISWNVGHLAWQEQRYFVTRAQGRTPFPDIQQAFATGAPASTPPLADVLAAWRAITAEADPGSTPSRPRAPGASREPLAQALSVLRQPAPADHLPLLVPHGREPGDPPAARARPAAAVRRQHIDDEAPYRPERER